MERLPVAAAQPGCVGGVIQATAQPPGGRPLASFGEQEIGWPAQPGMGLGPLRAALGDPFIQGSQGGGVERHGPLGGELAEWDFQPAAVAG